MSHRAEVCELATIFAEAAALFAVAVVDRALSVYRLIRTVRRTL